MRYLPLTDQDREAMLATIGAKSVDDLFVDVPPEARLEGLIKGLPKHQGEMDVEAALKGHASVNRAGGDGPFFCGAGVYRHHVPASVDYIIQRGEFLTAYTPYQPEIAQGTLQYLFEFQTQVAMLTGMDVANASMYDGSTACAEAVAMACRITRRRNAVLASGVHPHYAEVVETNGHFTGFGVDQQDASTEADFDGLLEMMDDNTACVVVQTPDLFGTPHDLTDLAEAVHAKGALLIVVVTEVVSLGLLTPPGEMGADIVVAEGQSIGNPMNFGGPHVGLFATRQKYVRQMPGRLCGETVDADGKRGFVLTLSTREQHIRRDKATSNICTNAGLCALAFTVHMSLLGEEGMKRLALLNHQKACALADAVSDIPRVEVLNVGFFNELCLRIPGKAADFVEKQAAKGLIAGVPVARLLPAEDMDDLLLVTATEMTSDDDIAALAAALKGKG
ncbi:MAG: aminomethyl-transferring glycine dehydrogenase subunit GcvPA [Alphaproteobacteria bacterium]